MEGSSAEYKEKFPKLWKDSVWQPIYLGRDVSTMEALKNGKTYIAETHELMQHMFVIGKSGEGKSNFLHWLMYEEAKSSRGLVLLDPHGALVEDVLMTIPLRRHRDVIVLDAGDDAYPFGINLFEPPPTLSASDRTVYIDQIVQAFKKAWGGQWGIQIETWLKVIAHTFIANGRGTMADIPQLLTDADFRETFMAAVEDDPAVAIAWENATNQRTGELRKEEIDSTLRRISIFLMNPLLRNIVAQPKTTVDFASFMAEDKIVLVKLPVQKLGKDTVQLMGTVLMQIIVQAAYSRKVGSHLFSIYADEFQHFATPDLQEVIMNLRKYGVGLTLATQTLANVPDEQIRRAVLACGSLACYQMTAEDARILAPEFREGGFRSKDDWKTKRETGQDAGGKYVETWSEYERPSRVEIANRLANLRALVGRGNFVLKSPRGEFLIGVPLMSEVAEKDNPEVQKSIRAHAIYTSRGLYCTPFHMVALPKRKLSSHAKPRIRVDMKKPAAPVVMDSLADFDFDAPPPRHPDLK